jgi:predicted aspartyl protease
MTTVNYSNNKPFSGAPARPLGDVVLHGPTGTSTVIRCVVDTGADLLQLPTSYAGAVGISLAGRAPTKARTAGGGASLVRVPGVNVEVEGVAVTVDVLFDPTNGAGLLGRNALKALQEVGIDLVKGEWLWL